MTEVKVILNDESHSWELYGDKSKPFFYVCKKCNLAKYPPTEKTGVLYRTIGYSYEPSPPTCSEELVRAILDE